MNTAYRLTLHALRRIEQRRLPVKALLAALDGVKRSLRDGNVLYTDPRSLCALVIRREDRTIITAMRLEYRRFRKLYGRNAWKRRQRRSA